MILLAAFRIGVGLMVGLAVAEALKRACACMFDEFDDTHPFTQCP